MSRENAQKMATKYNIRHGVTPEKTSNLFKEVVVPMFHHFNKAVVIALAVSALAGAQEVKVAPGRGVSVAGENVSVGIGGRIQARHTYEQEKEMTDFSIPRIRLALKGSMFKMWNWEFQSDFAKKEGTTLKDGLVEFAPADEFTIRFGQYKVAFDRQNLTSSGRQTFVDRAIASRSLGLGRDIGFMAHGKALEKKIQYSAGAFNGGGEGGRNKADRGHLIVARLSLNPLGDFGLAEGDIKKSDKHLLFADFSIAQQPDSSEYMKGTTRFVGGAGYRFAGIFLTGEYFHRTTSAEVKSNGFYCQAGYMIVKEVLELAGRYSQVDPDMDTDDNLQSEIMGGFNIFFNKLGHGLKLTTDLAWLKNEAKSEDSNFRSRIQAQLVF